MAYKRSTDRLVPLYKVVLGGDLGVGKTSIFQRYDIDKFFDYKSTKIGVDKLYKDVTVGDQNCKVSCFYNCCRNFF